MVTSIFKKLLSAFTIFCIIINFFIFSHINLVSAGFVNNYTPVKTYPVNYTSAVSVQDEGYEQNQTMFATRFTTAADITTLQSIFETGGGGTGLFIAINNGNLEVWMGSGNDLELTTPVLPSTTYTILLFADKTNDLLELYVSTTATSIADIKLANSTKVSQTGWTDTDWDGGNDMGVYVSASGIQGPFSGTNPFLGTPLEGVSVYNGQTPLLEGCMDSGDINYTPGATVDDGSCSSYDPIITLLGNPVVNILQNTSYTDAGASASDVEDGDITSDIVTVNPVDISTIGSYTITYDVDDSDSNSATQVTRTVNVLDPASDTGLNVAPVITSSSDFKVEKFDTVIGDITAIDNDNVVMQFGTDAVTGNTWKTQTHDEMCNPVVVSSSRNDVNGLKQSVVRVKDKLSGGFDIKVDNQASDIPSGQITDVDWVVMNAGTYDFIDDNSNIFHLTADSVETTTIFGNSCRNNITTTNIAFSPVFSATPTVIHSISSNNEELSIASTVNGGDGSYASDPSASNMGLFLQGALGVCSHSPENVDYIAMDQGHFVFDGVEIDSVKSADSIASVTSSGNPVTFSSAFSSVPQTILTSMLGVDGANGGHANVHTEGTITTTTFPATIDEDGTTNRTHTTEPVGALAFETASGKITQPNVFSYSLSGDDASKFQINSSGSLSFIIGQDGDNPTDLDTDGIYEVDVEVCDSHCNSKCSTQSVSVEVDKKPVLTLNGSGTISLIQGETYSELGASCSDSFDGSCTVTSTGTVNNTKVGTYTISYSATDSNGNVSDSISRTVNVTAASILINEVEYDTAGNEAESEWFEIFNPTSGIINIENWTITEKVGASSSKTYTFGDVNIPAGGYLLITNETLDFQALYPTVTPDIDLPGSTYFALKNTPSDELLLKDSLGNEIDFVAWENSSDGWNIEGKEASICRLSVPDTDTVADWTSSCTQTPGEENVFNNTPTDINISSDSIDENNTSGDSIGTFSSDDLDLADVHSYTLVSGTGDDDNSSFSISGSTLNIDLVSDYETKINYNIRVSTNDGNGGIFEKSFVINITNTNTAPTDITLSGSTIDENNSLGDIIGALNGSDDGENNNTLSYSLACDTPGVDDSSFSIAGTNVQAGDIFDYETKDTYNICIKVSDGALSYDENFIININDLDEVPPVVTITAPTKLQNSTITDTTITITDNVGINSADVSASGGTISCIQTSATQVDCSSNISVSGDLVITALDTSSNSGTSNENNYVVDLVAPNTPNISVDTTGPHSVINPEVSFSSLDNIAIDYYTLTYGTDDLGAGTGTLTTINPATSPVSLVLDPDETVHTIVVTVYDTAGNSSSSTVKFPPIINFTAPTTLSNVDISDSTVTITAPTGNDLTNITLLPNTTGASLGTCVGNGGDTTDPYATPVVCNIDNVGTSGTVQISAEDAGNGAEGLNSQSYIIDTTPPVISITAPNLLDNVSITDTTIVVTDDEAISSANVLVDGSSTVGSSSYTCSQISPIRVDCSISIDSTGDLTISVTDTAGNNVLTSQNNYIIDIVAPTLSLIGSDPEVTEYLSIYSDSGALYTDNIDGTGSVVGTGTVNTGILGSYTINYNYTDVAGNPATQISRVVNVVDTTPPVISVIGNAIETVEVNTSYSDSGASALDNYDGDISGSISVTNLVDISNTGSYLVSYDVDDSHSNSAITVSRTVNVVDTTPPVITLVGLDEIVIEVGGTYTDSGATVTDNYETLLPGNIIVDSSAVNTSVIGSYNVTYNIDDSSGNSALEVIRKVTIEDTTIPVISLVGNAIENIEINSTYTDSGATALDNYDGDISLNIVTNNLVDSSNLGTYLVKYNIIDSSSNSALEVTRTVNVVDTTPAIISLNGSGTITQEVGSVYNDLGAQFNDNVDGIGNITASGTVDTNTVGSYNLTYNHTDSSGNSAIQVSRTINIVDTTSPVISLNGNNIEVVVVGFPYTELGAICTDNYDSNCNTTSSGTVDTSSTGSTLITYNAIDSSGNSSSITRTVNVTLGDEPSIILNGSGSITHEVGTSYVDLGAIFTDTEDGSGSVVGSGTVDIYTLGMYTLTFDHIDTSGNLAEQLIRTVSIVDTTAPVVTLNGSTPENILLNGSFTDSGATWTDNVDGTGSINPASSGSVDTSTVGNYTLEYTYTDTNSNTGNTVTRTVNVVSGDTPTISLNGSGSITQEVGTSYTDLGVTYSDTEDGTGLVVASGAVDINTVGVYTLEYDFTDSHGNVAIQVMRTVSIVDTTAPVVTLVGSGTVEVLKDAIYTELGATWTDNVDGTGSINPASSGSVDTSIVGNYTLEYTYTDTKSNTGNTVTRTVNVVAGDTPTITLNGSGTITQEVGTSYTDLGAVYSDTEDGTGSVVASESVNTAVVGVYTLEYDFTDSHGNAATQVMRTVNIVDTTVPGVIPGTLGETVTDNSATISWQTSEPTSSEIVYGLTTVVDESTGEQDISPRVTSHTLTVTGLEVCTKYFYQTVSRDASGNELVDGIHNFTTTGCAGGSNVVEVDTTQIIHTGSGATGTEGTEKLSLGTGSQLLEIEVPTGYFDSGTGTCAGTGVYFQLKEIEKVPVVSDLGTPILKINALRTYDLSAYCSTNEKVKEFDTPLTVTMNYGASDIKGIKEASLVIYRYSVDTFSWEALNNCVNDSLNNTVTCETDHFSTFGVFGETSTNIGGGSRKKDVCPNGDYTESLYDRECGEKPEEPQEVVVKEIVDEGENIQNQTDSDLIEQIEEEIIQDVEDIQVLNENAELEKVMIKKVNGKAITYGLVNDYNSCQTIDNLLDENYSEDFNSLLNDINNFQQRELIERLEKAGVVSGTQEGNFEGDRHVSRVEFLKFVLRSHCIEYRQEDTSQLNFIDLDNSSWQAKVIKKSVDLGIANGDKDEAGNKIFRTDDVISSIEATKILLRMALVQKGEEPETLYKDLEVEWYKKYVQQGEYLGIFSAEDDNYTFNPDDGVNRNQTVEFLYKVIGLYR